MLKNERRESENVACFGPSFPNTIVANDSDHEWSLSYLDQFLSLSSLLVLKNERRESENVACFGHSFPNTIVANDSE